MPLSTSTQTLTSGGVPLDMSPDKFGLLHDSSPIAHDAPALRAQIARDGYLFCAVCSTATRFSKRAASRRSV